MDFIEPFLPDLLLTPDHKPSDIDAEIKALSIVQRMTEGFLKGTVPLEDLDECLFEFGVDPNEYWGVVEDSVDTVIEQERPIENFEFILLSPYA
jgi:hypothetical protein